MDSVMALEGANTVFNIGDNNPQELKTEDFLKILITELTNQDPFEPMKNQDLLAQIASIQELESTENMTKTFTTVGDQFDGLVNQLGNFLDREQLNSAVQMIGQTISGTTIFGETAAGKVVAVNISQDTIMLELDTGALIRLEDMSRLGGNMGANIVGSLVMGPAAAGEDKLIGKVASMEMDGDQITLKLESGEEMLMSEATVITADNAGILLGQFVEGTGQVQGFVQSYRIEGAGLEGVTLILDDGELPLTDLKKIRSTQEQNY